ncbi:hypothetical protein [Prochlorococcus sp. MIT 1307]|uniref:hypothetical protein n=1 Tax=Prochlorococcus sp. MIT 1307 TaxID=3096219 RepID=UPI002A75D412|nr:hypothetical protein [Prochlorococcus sp. MIT 1307]
MDETKSSSGKGMGASQGSQKLGGEQSQKSKKKKWTNKSGAPSDGREVLLKVGGLEYKAPGRRQRVVLGGIVLGGNLILVLAVILYFYNPSFKEFIIHVGK